MFSINWKMYIIFAVFNGLAFVHMFLAAPETKGMTLEEMDRVFETSRPPWRSAPPSSRLDALEKAIEAGNIKVSFVLWGAMRTTVVHSSSRC